MSDPDKSSSYSRLPRDILTTTADWLAPTSWNSRVDTLSLPIGHGWSRPFAEVVGGVQLWWKAGKYRAVITCGSRFSSTVYGLLQRLTPWRRTRTLLFDCLWLSPKAGLRGALRRVQTRIVVGPRTRAIVYSRRDRGVFSSWFGIPQERFVFIPYHTTLFGHPEPGPSSLQGTYIFAGGDGHRDYATLIAAIRGLEITLIIALRERSVLDGIDIPPNVIVMTTDHAGFRTLMANARINVVPMEGGDVRSGGHQTYLNAMAMGSPTVVTDTEAGSDYIDSWKDGVLVPPSDVKGLREAIARLLADEGLARKIGQAGRQVRDSHSTERILTTYLNFALSKAFTDPRVSAFGDERSAARAPIDGGLGCE